MTSIGIPALFAAGLLTFLSPCVLPLVPVYLAMLAGTSMLAMRTGERRRRLILATSAFALGIALVFVLLGLAVSALGHLLSSHRALVAQIAGLAVFLAGLKLVGVIQVPWLDREARPWLAKLGHAGGLFWPFLFGAAFALGWSPCVGPLLGSVLVYAAAAGSPAVAAAYLGVYALGLTLPLVAVAALAVPALRLLERAKRHLRAFEVTSGLVLAGLGLLFLTGHESLLGASPVDRAPVAAAGSAVTGSAPAACSAEIPQTGAAPAWSTPVVPLDRTPTMVEFVAAGCPICRRMTPVVAAAERDCSRHGVQVEEVDVATADGRRRASAHGVLGVPTFLFLDRHGNEVARLIGEQPPQTLRQSLEVLAGEKCDGFRPLPLGATPGT